MSPTPTRPDGDQPAAGSVAGSVCGSVAPAELSREESGAAERRREAQRWMHRRRLERRLHDGAALRLSALTLRLGLLPRAGCDEREWRALVGELQDELHQVLQELRGVAGQLYPPLLDQAGLAPALRELAERVGTELDIEVAATAQGRRFGAVAEGAAYFAVAECLTEGRTARRARVLGDADALVFTLDGVGPPCLARVLDQVWPLGGTAEPAGPADGVPCDGTPADGDGSSAAAGQTITVRIPCA